MIDDENVETYKDFADEIDDHINDSNKNNEYVDDSNESHNGRLVKRTIGFSITRENGKIIHSSETIPPSSLLINAIGATIGNCLKDGDEFKFNLNVEEDGSINLQLHAPNNKTNNGIILKLFESISDENRINSNVMDFVQLITMKLRGPSMRPGPNGSYSNPWGGF